MVYKGNLSEGLPAAQGDDRMRRMRVVLSDNQVWIELDAHCALYDNVEFVTGAVLFKITSPFLKTTTLLMLSILAI